MNEITEEMVWAAGVAVNPELFSTIPHEAHRAASPRRVEVVREEILGRCRLALSAALAAAEEQEPLAWISTEMFKFVNDGRPKSGLWQMSTEKACDPLRECTVPLYTRPSPPSGEAVEARRLALEGLSQWTGWDQSNSPWSETWHKDAVCKAAFGPTWSMEDARALISFIEGTWTRALTQKDKADE